VKREKLTWRFSLKIDSINISAAINEVEKFLKKEKDISPAFKATIELLLVVVTLLVNRLNLNSNNSSKPPSKDPNRKRALKAKGERKPGGQNGHSGTNLKKVDNPDEIIPIKVDKRTIAHGSYKEVGWESRQVIDIEISRHVIEYRAQILEDEAGKKFIAKFPKNVNRLVQYGAKLKAEAVYMSQYQLIPYKRIEEHYQNQIGISISAGSICNFNKEAFCMLDKFEEFIKKKLIESPLLNADETGINKDGKQYWLHSLSNKLWTYFYPHKRRGSEAMDEMGILPNYKGTICHDHWKPYYTYDCIHALCNAHHLRELERAWEQDGQSWAKDMKELLESINIAVKEAGGEISSSEAKKYETRYEKILNLAENECPPAEKKEGSRGRIKNTKSRNLLERLRNYSEDTLRFMEDINVPFTNNQSENDIRMTKVQQKISGCFRSLEGAKYFCRIRSYISTCRKQGIGAIKALNLLFQGESPDFMK
jgi:transposase